MGEKKIENSENNIHPLTMRYKSVVCPKCNRKNSPHSVYHVINEKGEVELFLRCSFCESVNRLPKDDA